MKMTCAFATSLDTPEHIRIAEQLGFERAFCYDSPALYPDVWVQLCRAADLTERIVLGPGVLIPSLRHPMVTAAAISTLAAAAGSERVQVGVGSGFTGRITMGKRPVPMAKVQAYIETVKALLRGEQVEWEDAVMQMIHPDERFAPARPLEVLWAIAAEGPKGLQMVREIGGGVELLSLATVNAEFSPQTMIFSGTVLDEGEDPGSERVIDAGGAAAGLILHWAVEHDAIDELLPAQGQQWAAAYEHVPENVRHLAIHDRHMIEVNATDRPFLNGDLMVGTGAAASSQAWRDRMNGYDAAGATAICFQPSGHDIPRELEAFAAMYVDR